MVLSRQRADELSELQATSKPTNGEPQLPSGRKGGTSLLFVALMRHLRSLFSEVSEREVFRARLENPQDYKSVLTGISLTLKKINEDIKKGAISEGKNSNDLASEIKENTTTLASKHDNQVVGMAEMVGKLEEIKATFEQIDIPEHSNKDVVTQLAEIKKELSTLPKSFPVPEKVVIPKPEKVNFPNTMSFKESGAILNSLNTIQTAIKTLPLNMPVPKEGKAVDLSPLLRSLEEVKNAVQNIPQPGAIDFPEAISIDNFPPQKYPLPVTNININSLRGPVLSSVATVTSTRSVIPENQLANRRSLLFYNNHDSETLFIGGSDVTVNNGLPVAPKQYSPSMDVGDLVSVYGIASKSISIRIFEASTVALGA